MPSSWSVGNLEVGLLESLTRWAMCVRPQALSGLYPGTTGPARRPPFDFGDM